VAAAEAAAEEVEAAEVAAEGHHRRRLHLLRRHHRRPYPHRSQPGLASRFGMLNMRPAKLRRHKCRQSEPSEKKDIVFHSWETPRRAPDMPEL